MGQQTVRWVRLQSADATDTRRLPAVHLSMLPQEPLAVEGITTDFAAERGRLRGLGSRGVSFGSPWLQSLSPTVLTPISVRFLGRQMLLNPVGSGVGGPPAVDLFVPPQRPGPGEALAADFAAERFDSCVTPRVRLHVLKGFATDRTRPGAA